MGRSVLSDVSYRKVATKAMRAGSATYAGEQRQKQGKGLDPLVDPKEHGLIRRSLSWLEPRDGYFELLRGVAMLEETRLDTTGSMGDNVEVAMRVLPKAYKLLATGKNPILARYDTQMITSMFGDVVDKYVLLRSQAEMDDRIAEQMTLMVPEHAGGDSPEDPQYGIFGGAFLTQTSINSYGLKYYDFTVTDAPGRMGIEKNVLHRVFGDSVFEKVAENGYQIDPKNIPDTRETVAELAKRAHPFLFQVGASSETSNFWMRVYGKERIVSIPNVEFLSELKAVVIGLTEGVLDLQTVEEYLMHSADMVGEDFSISNRHRSVVKMDKDIARAIKIAVTHIPIGAQMLLPNFDKIPLKGAKFAKKGDIWPMDSAQAKSSKKEEKTSGSKKPGKWL
jgi:hypothetical protein